MKSEIRLSELIAYAKIYGLDIKDSDVKELQKLHDTYKDDFPNTTIYYKIVAPNVVLTTQLGRSQISVALDDYDEKTALPTPYLKIGYYGVTLLIGELVAHRDLEYVVMFKELHTSYYGENTTDPLIFATLADFKNYLLSENATRTLRRDLNADQMKLFYWAANDIIKYHKKVFEHTKEFIEDLPEYAAYIVDVLEKNNIRTALLIGREDHQEWSYNTNSNKTHSVPILGVYSIEVGHPAYNWTDKDRYFYKKDGSMYSPGTLYFSDPNPSLPKNETIVANLSRGKEFVIVDNTTLDIAIKRENRKELESKRRIAATKVLSTRMVSKIKEMEAGTPFTFNDITFYSNKTEYAGQTLQDSNTSTSEVLKHFSGNYSDDNLNFDRFFDCFIQKVIHFTEKHSVTRGIIGNIKYVLKITSSKANSGLWYINDIRVNKLEVTEALLRGLCYTDQKDYDNFLHTISRCSLRIHKYLASGVPISAQDEILNTKLIFKLPLIRKGHLNYISLSNKEFKISDINRLLNIEKYRRMSEVIGVLLNPTVLGLDGDQIKFIIEEGQIFYKKSQELEQTLINNTFKLFNITEDSFNMQNGRTIEGYFVKGKKHEYIIEKDTLAVFENPTGRYICMVDKIHNEFNGTAKLVNRIYALANDAVLSKEIHTLNY
jgi:hypothetical protein